MRCVKEEVAKLRVQRVDVKTGGSKFLTVMTAKHKDKREATLSREGILKI